MRLLSKLTKRLQDGDIVVREEVPDAPYLAIKSERWKNLYAVSTLRFHFTSPFIEEMGSLCEFLYAGREFREEDAGFRDAFNERFAGKWIYTELSDIGPYELEGGGSFCGSKGAYYFADILSEERPFGEDRPDDCVIWWNTLQTERKMGVSFRDMEETALGITNAVSPFKKSSICTLQLLAVVQNHLPPSCIKTIEEGCAVPKEFREKKLPIFTSVSLRDFQVSAHGKISLGTREGVRFHPVAAHDRRATERHLPSGRVVPVKASRVKAHGRGDKALGVVRKVFVGK